MGLPTIPGAGGSAVTPKYIEIDFFPAGGITSKGTEIVPSPVTLDPNYGLLVPMGATASELPEAPGSSARDESGLIGGTAIIHDADNIKIHSEWSIGPGDGVALRFMQIALRKRVFHHEHDGIIFSNSYPSEITITPVGQGAPYPEGSLVYFATMPGRLRSTNTPSQAKNFQVLTAIKSDGTFDITQGDGGPDEYTLLYQIISL